jgi:ATP-dependent DNA ligase I
MLLADLAATSRAVGETRSRLEKVDRLAALLRRLGPEEVGLVASWLAGDLPQGRIGIGGAVLREAMTPAPAPRPSLSVAEVDRAFEELARVSGAGSSVERRRRLGALLGRATPEERDFLARLVLGELRQGALEGVLVEAVAKASGAPAAEVRRAAMAAGALPPVAAAALAGGPAALARFALRVLEPVQPMLAQTAADPVEALAALGEAGLEHKLDGARVQVHRQGGDVRIFTRSLREVTGALPEILESALALPVRSVVLDGEALALRPDGTPEPFQVTMRRFGAKLDVSRLRRELPLSLAVFDALHLDGADLAARPARERIAALEAAVPPALRVPRIVTADPAQAAAFLDEALRRGHEGVMAKSLDAPYEAGRRGSAWLKVKPARTLDLVVLAAEWGHGRRAGWLSNLHLGARDPAAGGFVMLGKTFKGMTDAMLAWQTERLLALKVAQDRWTVHVRPALVAEVAFDGLQTSPRYPAGLALRFARVRRYREDKRPDQADTIETVRAIHAGEVAREQAAGAGLR